MTFAKITNRHIFYSTILFCINKYITILFLDCKFGWNRNKLQGSMDVRRFSKHINMAHVWFKHFVSTTELKVRRSSISPLAINMIASSLVGRLGRDWLHSFLRFLTHRGCAQFSKLWFFYCRCMASIQTRQLKLNSLL